MGAALLVVLPWTMRNKKVHGALVPVTTNSGESLYAGLSPEATGGTGGRYSRGIDFVVPDDIPLEPEAARHRALAAEALGYTVRHPVRVLLLVPRKFWNMWRPWVVGASPWSWAAAAGLYVPTVLLALVGIVRFGARPRGLSLVYVVLAYGAAMPLLSLSAVRYRYPLLPLLILLAAMTLAGMLLGERPAARGAA
jgi:hypothetical protein